MINVLSSLIHLSAAGLSSAVSHGQMFLLSALSGNFALVFLKNILLKVLNWIVSLLWIIEKFVLGLMDALQMIVYEFLGIGSTMDDYLNFASKNDFTGTLVKTFRAVFVVAIVLMIIFTIVAIIRQEIEVATNQKDKGSEEKNKKGPIVMKLFKGILSVIILPFAMIAIIGAVNSVLTAFNNALKGDNEATIAGQVLATSTYDTNKYRTYANSNKRIPIVIEAYNVDDYKPDEREDLLFKIKSFTVQQKLKQTASNIGNGILLSFNDALIYENNRLTNSSAFGDYYENFICTAEQYQVMADFVDYCELTNTNFYIKAIDDNDIEWKYVDSSIYDSVNKSLNITYRDANDIDKDGSKSDTYSVTFSMGFEVSSPISSALDSISALLGIGDEYNGFKFNEMERDPNSVNMVSWANEKVSIHFSKDFDIRDMSSWTTTDEILMYEYYHFSSNNTLAEFDFNDLSFENRGNATLDAYKIEYRDYYADADAYSKVNTIYCVPINGTYYKITKSELEADEYGNKLFVLSEIDGVKFLEKSYSIISEEPETAVLRFTGRLNSFNLNDPSTWSYTDQILIYEYYKDLSYNNTFSNSNISDFSSGLEVPTYKIRDYDAAGKETNARYVLMNGTYYEVVLPAGSSYYRLKAATNSSNFLDRIEDKYNTSYYNYSGSNGMGITINDADGEFGISTDLGSGKTANDFIINSSNGSIFETLERFYADPDSAESLASGVTFSSIDFDLRFSHNFDYRDVSTWSYKDYFLFYTFARYLVSSGLTTEVLKETSLQGSILSLNGKNYFRINSNLTEKNEVYKAIYLCVEPIDEISTQNIKNVLNHQITYENNRLNFGDIYNSIFINATNSNATLLSSESEYKTFTFSRGVSFSSVSEWKMRDYLLFLLDSREYISITSSLEDYEYNAACYIISGVSSNNVNRLYRFGTNANNTAGVYKDIYLNEKYILNFGFSTLDEWLDTKLTDFLALRLGVSNSKLILDENEIISSIANSSAISDKTYSLSSLFAMLVKEYGKDAISSKKLFEEYDSISSYTYNSPNLAAGTFSADDLSSWTYLDLAIYAITGSATGTYTSNIISHNGQTKFIVGDYALDISSSTSPFKSTVNNADLTIELDSVSSPFTLSANSYTAFGGDPETSGYNYMESLILWLTGSTEAATYSVYETTLFGGKKYIYVDGEFVEFIDKAVDFANIVSGHNDYEKLIDILINNFYSSYISGNIGSTTTLISNFEYDITSFNIDDVKTYSPLLLILHRIGVIDGFNNFATGSLVKSTTNSNLYFVVKYTDVNNATETYNINVTEFLNEDGIDISSEVQKLRYRAALCYSIEDTGEFIEPEVSANGFINLVENINSEISSHITGSFESSPLGFTGSLVEESLGSWNWLDILSNYYVGSYRTTDSYVYFKDANCGEGEVYIRLTNGSKVKYIKFDKSLVSDDAQQNKLSIFGHGTERVSFSLSTNSSTLSLISFKYSGNVSSTLSYSSISVNDSELRIYVFYDAENYSYVYYVSDPSEVSEIESSSTEDSYKYTVTATTYNLYSWNVLDYLIKACSGNTSELPAIIYSKIYTFNGRKYLLISSSNRYIDLTALGNQVRVNEADLVLDGTSLLSLAEGYIGFRVSPISGDALNNDNNFKSSLISVPNSVLSKVTHSLTLDGAFNSNKVKLYFSRTFNYSDFSSWTNSDFLLYYLYKTGHTDSDVKSFQHYVNLGYVPAVALSLENYDNYGNLTVNTVYKLGEDECDFGAFGKIDASSIEEYRQTAGSDAYQSFIRKITEYNFINAEIWSLQYSKTLSNISVSTNDSVDLIVSMTSSPVQHPSVGSFGISVVNEINSRDFIYENYYYFNINFDSETIINLRTDPAIADALRGQTPSDDKTVNFKLSEGFKISDISTWTILDYIIVREFSRDSSNSSTFGGVTFDKLKDDYLLQVYSNATTDGTAYYIRVNEIFYNITDAIIETTGELGETLIELDETTGKLVGAVSASSLSSEAFGYDFRAKESEMYFDMSLSKEEISRQILKTRTSLIYTLSAGENNYTYVRNIDTNLERNFKVILELLDTYEISKLVLQVNWVQKLMNDMQVLYPDLNWANLIANDAWLDTLGDYHSAYASGQFISSGNSANVSAAGLVLSEFLLTLANESYTGYADFEYTSTFNKDTIQSLMLAMLGESKYEDLRLQAEVFVEMFNYAFAGILDDVAEERGISIVDGKVSNLTMSVYKAYLATVLMSSDLGEYLYTIATRVYAQYAIYESLAYAGGDYSTYYAYINGLADENGDIVNAFKYGSFKDLVIFENQGLREGAVPTYTFNYLAAYREFIYNEATKEEAELSLRMGEISFLANWICSINKTSYASAISLIDSLGIKEGYGASEVATVANKIDATRTPSSYSTVLSRLRSAYESKYLSYRGCTASYADNDAAHYSYLLHVNYAIKQDLKNKLLTTPTYLRIYDKFITGSISRWQIESDISVNATSTYIQNYDLYKVLRSVQKLSYIGSYMGIYFPKLSVSIQSEEDLEEYQEMLSVGSVSVDIDAPIHRLREIFGPSQKYSEILNSVFANDLFDVSDILNKTMTFQRSEDGSVSSWESILKTKENLELLINELSEVMSLPIGYHTENMSVRVNYHQNVYNDLAKSLNSLLEKLDTYIGTQNIIDKIEKASITFTLAQYSNNYVESGFNFTIKNKSYTLNTAVSPQRLAEYVYGGAFLEQFGVSAKFTSSDFHGIIHQSKAVDPKDDVVKTKLDCFPELREFAGSIANYTAKLYFLTNMTDLSENVSDSMLLSEELYSTAGYIGSYLGNNGGAYKTSLEYLLLDHIVSSEELSAKLLVTKLFKDTEDTLNRLGCTDEYIMLLAKSVSGSKEFTEAEKNFINTHKGLVAFADDGSVALTDDFTKMALRRYLVYIQTTSSNIKTIDSTGYTYLSGGDINGYYGLYQANGYNSNGGYSNGADTASERIHVAFKSVIEYLIISEEKDDDKLDLGVAGNYVNLDGISFKELKIILTEALVDYKKNESEDGADNAARYLTLFNLVSGQFNYYINDSGNLKSIGTTLSSINKDSDTLSNLVGYQDPLYGTKYSLYADFIIDRSTRGTILKLCGIENRPIEELVNLEYNELYKKDGDYDEAKGDIFIVCSYDDDTGKYVPFLATNKKYSGQFSGTNYLSYLEDYNYRIYTDYYDSESGTRFAYPIIAKGILTADLKPTAIKIQDNVAKFYRTDISATTRVEDTALSNKRTTVETTTMNYVNFVNISTFDVLSQNTEESKTSFLASSDVMSFINSDASVSYIQQTNIFNLAKTDGFDGISVLDSFAAFFKMSFQMHFMILLGFVTLVPLLFRASAAVLKRVLDLIFLVLAGPLCISMNSLNYTDDEHQAYKSWKKYMFGTLLSVFGIVIAFNLYFILISITMNMTFISPGDSTMQRISAIGGLSFVTAPLLNGFVKFSFVIVATNIIESSADMLLNMITGGKASKSFDSALTGDNPINSIVNMAKEMKNNISKGTHFLQDAVSGKLFLEAKNAIVESLPGMQIARGVASGVGNIRNMAKSIDLYKKAIGKGVGPGAALVASREYRNNYKKQQQNKKQRRESYASSFYGRMGMNFGGK